MPKKKPKVEGSVAWRWTRGEMGEGDKDINEDDAAVEVGSRSCSGRSSWRRCCADSGPVGSRPPWGQPRLLVWIAWGGR
jgi:hypothetical protein